MRDLLLAFIVFGSVPFILRRPFYGILLLTWISLMNPHRLAYGWAFSFPWAEIIAIATIVGLALAIHESRLFLNFITVLLISIVLFTGLTSVFALHPDLAWPAWSRFAKTILITFLMIALVRTKSELRWLMLCIALSVGFYGFKGGIFSLATGGRHLVLGPAKSYIATNNPLGLALNMIIPICFYLGQMESRKLLKWFLYATGGLSAISVMFTYSRGDLLGLIAVALLMAMRTKSRVAILTLLALFLGIALWIAPDKWFDRQETTLEYSQDRSAVSRLNAWEFGWRIARRHPLTGLGFACHSPSLYAQYFPESTTDNDFHSIYFGMLGEHGFPGLMLFLMVLAATFLKLRQVRRSMSGAEEEAWYRSYSTMIGTALIGYVVSGAFLSLQYFDLPYYLIAATVILDRQARMDLKTCAVQGHEDVLSDGTYAADVFQPVSQS